jgi:hypothetical protein
MHSFISVDITLIFSIADDVSDDEEDASVAMAMSTSVFPNRK